MITLEEKMKECLEKQMRKEEPDEKEKQLKIAEQAIKNTPRVHVLSGLPEALKDPANYNKIQKALLDTLASKHSHGEMTEWANCVQCQKKLREHGMMMRGLGFNSPQQYMAWKKVHETIERRVKLR